MANYIKDAIDDLANERDKYKDRAAQAESVLYGLHLVSGWHVELVELCRETDFVGSLSKDAISELYASDADAFRRLAEVFDG